MSPTGTRLVGTVLDNRYLIEAPIARGGMSTVFRGSDRRLGRKVAVKVMHAEFAADPAFLSRFEFEARAVAGLKDPGLVSVYDQGVDGDHAFLVMELVRGGTLRELLRERGPMPPHAAAAVTRPALTALAAAHRAGLVHRDVKPENVLISDDGEVKLADFGLVRAVAGTTATSSSVILGTAAYLSPEQVRTGRADPRSDVYSVGVLLFEMLTGRTPFTADTNLAIAYRRLEEDVPPPSTFIAGVPREFDELVMHATERDPDARFHDAADMGAALDSVSARMHLPGFRVPAPRNSAQHRSMVVPPPPTPSGDDQAPTTGVDGATAVVPPIPPGVPPGDDPDGLAATRAGFDDENIDGDNPYDGPDDFADSSADAAAAGPTATRQYTAMHPRDEYEGYGEQSGPAPEDGAAGAAAAVPYSSRAARQRTRSRRSAVLWALLIAALAVLLGVAGWWFASGRLTTVPSTEGMDKAAVVAAIAGADLTPKVRGTYSDAAPVDTVLEVTPSAGTRIARSSDVTVQVSLGRPTVPDLTKDADVDAVLAQLRERTLAPERGTDEFSTTVPEGRVLRLNPGSGTVVPVGSKVTVTTSKGPPPIHVPEVAGMPREEATDVLTKAGLKVGGVRTAFDPGVDGGEVAGTDPATDAVIPAGSTVTLIVSNAVTVPDITGKRPAAARAALADAGIAMVDGGKTSETDARAGTVGKTSPAAGDRVDPDHAQVTVYVSNTVAVPGLLGRTVGSARSTLDDLGLHAKVRQLLDGDNSIVITQSPSSGSRLKPGETVTLTAVP